MSATVVDHLLERLAANGVHHVFGYQRDQRDHGRHGPLEFVQVRHLDGAVRTARTERTVTCLIIPTTCRGRAPFPTGSEPMAPCIRLPATAIRRSCPTPATWAAPPRSTATVGVLAYRAVLLGIPAVRGATVFLALLHSQREEAAARIPSADDIPATVSP